MAKGTKTIIKVLIGVGILFALMVGGFFFVLYRAIDNSIEEGKRIEALPNVAGIICNENNVVAPLSGDIVAFYYLEYSARYKSSKFSNSSTSYEDEILYAAISQMCLNLEDQNISFDFSPNARIFKNTASDSKDWKLALTLAFNGAPDLPPDLLGLYQDLDCAISYIYEDTFGKEVKISGRCSTRHYQSLDVTEHVWYKGDSIQLKGEIINNQMQLRY